MADAMAMEVWGKGDMVIDRKPDGSPVTITDRQIEQVLRQRIEAAFPDDGIVGEEFGVTNGNARRLWLLDPIDGTKSFMRGNENWATLIALLVDGVTEIAVASGPAMSQRYRAQRGRGATCNGEPIHVSTVANVGEAMLSHTSVAGFTRIGQEDRLESLARQCWDTRGSGNSFSHLSVARGTADIGWTSMAHEWDYAAPALIVEEAGGKFYNGAGRGTSGPGISSNGLLHEIALEAAQLSEGVR